MITLYYLKNVIKIPQGNYCAGIILIYKLMQ